MWGRDTAFGGEVWSETKRFGRSALLEFYNGQVLVPPGYGDGKGADNISGDSGHLLVVTGTATATGDGNGNGDGGDHGHGHGGGDGDGAGGDMF